MNEPLNCTASPVRVIDGSGMPTYSFVEISIVYKVYSTRILPNWIKVQLSVCDDMLRHPLQLPSLAQSKAPRSQSEGTKMAGTQTNRHSRQLQETAIAQIKNVRIYVFIYSGVLFFSRLMNGIIFGTTILMVSSCFNVRYLQ